MDGPLETPFRHCVFEIITFATKPSFDDTKYFTNILEYSINESQLGFSHSILS